MAALLAAGLQRSGIEIVHQDFFDTIHARVPGRADAVIAAALEAGTNLRRVDADTVGISTDEVTLRANIVDVWGAFGVDRLDVDELDQELLVGDWFRLPPSLRRSSSFLTHPVFHGYRSETEMLRYLRMLQDKDVALDRSMIPLGSCTMKLNATTEMAAISWPEFANIHPFAPIDQASGYLQLIDELERWLVAITGYDAVSLQPNAGSQGEFAGLLAIRAYHDANGDTGRNVCLVPASAHGTNAASAVMAGMKVVVVASDDEGHVELADLKAKIEQHRDALAALMITYPSTHGVYEAEVSDVCAMIHEAGGQVYVDGANLNALVGLAQPGKFGADVSHLNLHKTFCIPHGGGGPGIGPIGVRAHLAPFLPNHPLVAQAGPETGVGPVTAAPWGSAGILPISWAYIRLMGPDGLTHATKAAVLAANYVAKRVNDHFPVLYTGDTGLVAHECILDLRGITKETGVTVDDVAKRLIDYGFHAPTMSFPVAGTLMVEPTESEGLRELDRFVEALVAIRGEVDRVAAGEWTLEDSPLRHAPHTASCLVDGEWPYTYSRANGRLPGGLLAVRQVLAAGASHRRRLRRPAPGLLLPARRRVRGLKQPWSCSPNTSCSVSRARRMPRTRWRCCRTRRPCCGTRHHWSSTCSPRGRGAPLGPTGATAPTRRGTPWTGRRAGSSPTARSSPSTGSRRRPRSATESPRGDAVEEWAGQWSTW